VSPAFGAKSAERLATLDPKLRELFEDVVREYDCVILVGHRGKADQDKAVAAGLSKTPWPTGKHNSLPSKAADVAPFDPRAPGGVNWGEDLRTKKPDRAALARFYHFAGFVKGRALVLGIRIRWGGDWDGDTFFDDQTFNDLVHFELVG